jgi:hypothetical protein
VKRESACRVSKWVPCAENFKERAGTIKRTKNTLIWVRLQCSHASRKFFLGIEDGSLEEMEGAEYNIRPGLLAESRDTREKKKRSVSH